MKQKEFKEENINKNNKEDKMSNYIKHGRKYYTTRLEAIKARRRGERIYYDEYEGAYYIARPQKDSFWGL